MSSPARSTVTEAERRALADIYAYILRCSRTNKAAGEGGSEDPVKKEITNSHVNRSIPERS